MKKKYYIWKVSINDSGKKLLIFLKEKLMLSNRQVKNVLEKGLCLINNKVERFGSISLKHGTEIKLHSSWKAQIKEKKNISLKILYEDEYFLAIDKPLNFVCSDKNVHLFFPKKYTLIHRLDKDTTGVLLIAKNEEFKNKMMKLFKENKIEKIYWAYIDGQIKEKDKKIESNIEKKKAIDGQTIYGPSSDGKYALTHLSVLKRYKNATLVELVPITGRTHQLRVHMKQISHPILGDFLYAKKFCYSHLVPRLMLHCLKVEFIHPRTHENISIISEVNDSFSL